MNQKVNWLLEQMRLARHRQFGVSSEKSQYDTLNLFNEAEITADNKRPFMMRTSSILKALIHRKIFPCVKYMV
ncbi:hypothetical protein [Sporomusa termitida]|uniref:IS66 family transposase n=1 Tax=Sporomusa termitida TaxID=2377 RepID=UPI0014786B95